MNSPSPAPTPQNPGRDHPSHTPDLGTGEDLPGAQTQPAQSHSSPHRVSSSLGDDDQQGAAVEQPGGSSTDNGWQDIAALPGPSRQPLVQPTSSRYLPLLAPPSSPRGLPQPRQPLITHLESPIPTSQFLQPTQTQVSSIVCPLG